MRWMAMLLLLAGCDGADANRRGSVTVETLPNGAVRVTNPAQGLWSDDSSWRLVPELQLGELDGAEAMMFAAVSGLEVDDQGRIYVLDRQTNELRIYTREGAHVRTVGRSGGGPGEYTAANGLLWLSPDSLLVVDQEGGRYSILTGEGDFVRSVPRTLGFYGWAFSGGTEAGRIYEHSSVGADPDRRPALLGTSLSSGRVPAADRGGPATDAAVDTILLPVPNGPAFEPFSVRTERAGMSMPVPFAPGAVYRLDGQGGVWHGHGSEFRLIHSALSGDTIMEILLDAAPAPVTTAEIEEWESRTSVARFREMGGRLDMSRIPRSKPFFDGVYVDPDRHLWVSVPAGPKEAVFAVFDPEGRYLGRLQANGLKRDRFLPPVVRNGRLYLVGRDELDVQRVHVFRIDR